MQKKVCVKNRLGKLIASWFISLEIDCRTLPTTPRHLIEEWAVGKLIPLD